MLTRYACTAAELSCVIGNIFAELSPPCAACGAEVLQITGTTVTGNAATLTVTEAGFDFDGCADDTAMIERMRKGRCIYAKTGAGAERTDGIQLKHGVDFLGFHTYLTESGAVIRKVRRRSKNNMKRKLKKLAALHAAGRIDGKTVEQSYQSWRGHAEKGNSYHLIRRTDHYYNSLMKSKEAAQCQKH
jgi:hypothetical protein